MNKLKVIEAKLLPAKSPQQQAQQPQAPQKPGQQPVQQAATPATDNGELPRTAHSPRKQKTAPVCAATAKPKPNKRMEASKDARKRAQLANADNINGIIPSVGDPWPFADGAQAPAKTAQPAPVTVSPFTPVAAAKAAEAPANPGVSPGASPAASPAASPGASPAASPCYKVPPPANGADIEYDSEETTVAGFLEYIGAKKFTGLNEEYQGLKNWNVTPCLHETFDKHLDENRYKDVPCLEATRVRLPAGPGNPPPDSCSAEGTGWSDYLHANYVDDFWLDKPAPSTKYICAQGPMDSTCLQFWRMVWHEKAATVIMLCCVREMGKEKCAQYWPLEQGAKMTFGSLRVTAVGAQVPFPFDRTDKTEIILVTKILLEVLKPDGEPTGEKHEMKHMQWTSWPDKSVPLSPKAVVMFARHMRRFNGTACVIHCSAGIGRTGTLLMLCVILQRIQLKRSIDVPKMLKSVRTQRWNSIQTPAQYLFVYRAVLQFLMDDPQFGKMTKSHRGAMEFFEEYEKLIRGG